MNSAYESEYRQLGLRIAYYRKLRGLTQEQLAEKVDRTPAFIGHVEAPNIKKAVSLDTLFQIDRLPTAKVISQDAEGWLIEAEVFGKGAKMWLQSQGEYITQCQEVQHG